MEGVEEDDMAKANAGGGFVYKAGRKVERQS